MSTWNWLIRSQTGGTLSKKCLAKVPLGRLLNAGMQKPTVMMHSGATPACTEYCLGYNLPRNLVHMKEKKGIQYLALTLGAWATARTSTYRLQVPSFLYMVALEGRFLLTHSGVVKCSRILLTHMSVVKCSRYYIVRSTGCCLGDLVGENNLYLQLH